MTGKEKWQGQRTRQEKPNNNSDASGQPASPCHAWATPARGRRACTSRLRNRGVTGQAQTVGLPVHKNRCDCCPPA